jgi:hypothetical protein
LVEAIRQAAGPAGGLPFSSGYDGASQHQPLDSGCPFLLGPE